MGVEAGLDSGVQGLTEGSLLEQEGPGKQQRPQVDLHGQPPPTGSTQAICAIPSPGQGTGLQDPTHGGAQRRVEAGVSLLLGLGPRGPRVSLKGPRQLSGRLITTQRGESSGDLHTGMSVRSRAHAHWVDPPALGHTGSGSAVTRTCRGGVGGTCGHERMTT